MMGKFDELNYRQLQDELRNRDLPSGGSEDELRARLEAADASPAASAAEGDAETATVAPEDAAARENERQARAAAAAADSDAQKASEAGVPNAPVRAYDDDGNVRPADARFVDERAQVEDRRATQVPVAPGSAATMKPVLDSRGRLYPGAASDLDDADEIKARLESEREAREAADKAPAR